MVYNQCNLNVDTSSCTLETCCWKQGFVEYPPQFAGSVAYLTIFAIFLVLQALIGLYYRTWGFLAGMVCGLILEVLGYAARIMIRSNPFSLNIFLLYFIPLGLGPAFLTFSIYLTLARIVVVYGERYSRFLPRTYTLVFVTCDISSLCVQAVGGALASIARDSNARQQGVDVLIAGLTFQAFSLALFLILCLEFAWRVRRADVGEHNPQFLGLRSSPRFKLFLWAIATASIAIFIRCVYRVIELAGGFSGAIANAETPFMILEGPMIMIAVLAMSAFHPGIVFRGGSWEASKWMIRPGNKGGVETERKEVI